MNSLEHRAEKCPATQSITNKSEMSVWFPEIHEWGEFDSYRQGLILSKNRVQLSFWSVGGKIHKASNNTFFGTTHALFCNQATPSRYVHEMGAWQRGEERMLCFSEWASARRVHRHPPSTPAWWEWNRDWNSNFMFPKGVCSHAHGVIDLFKHIQMCKFIKDRFKTPGINPRKYTQEYFLQTTEWVTVHWLVEMLPFQHKCIRSKI